jgi:hypothetical protein
MRDENLYYRPHIACFGCGRDPEVMNIGGLLHF